MNRIKKINSNVSYKINGVFKTVHLSTDIILIIGLFIIN